MSVPCDPLQGLVVVPAEIVGPSGRAVVRLALDTGATGTVVNVGIASGDLYSRTRVGMEQTIRVSQLGVPTLSRARGREACEHLREQWSAASAAIQLDGVSMLSLSFLDGLVLGLLAAGRLDHVTFVTQDPRTVGKLERVAGLHPGVALYMRHGASEARRRVTPALVEHEDAPLESSKSLA